MKNNKKIDYKESSGNVFADLGVADSDAALAKAEVARLIRKIVKKKKLNQTEVAKKLKIDQPKVSLLLRGYLTNFSLERLLRFLNLLGQDVCISIVPTRRLKKGSTKIVEIPPEHDLAA